MSKKKKNKDAAELFVEGLNAFSSSFSFGSDDFFGDIEKSAQRIFNFDKKPDDDLDKKVSKK